MKMPNKNKRKLMIYLKIWIRGKISLKALQAKSKNFFIRICF